MVKKKKGINTRAIHTESGVNISSNDAMPPLHLTTTFASDTPEMSADFVYSRIGNPTRRLFEKTIASLEGIENYEEQHGIAVSTGMSATDLVSHLMVPGDRIVITNSVYGGTINYFTDVAPKNNIEATFIDFTDLDKVDEALNEKTKIVWLETPSNPLMNVINIKEVASIVHSKGGLLVCDSSFSTPFITRPLEHGADIVIHSTTKYIGGHSDTMGGVVVAKDLAIHTQLLETQRRIGTVLSPFDSYLCQRGLYTLGTRIKVHSSNALELAKSLETCRWVEKVNYPGLEKNEFHTTAKAQMDLYGGMLSFAVSDEVNLMKIAENIQLFKLAVSFGSVESLIEIPYLMTHKKAGDTDAAVPENLIRVSAGLEDYEDLIEDLLNGIDGCIKK
jgi:cystathionine beta-lyase/cystathionine gamma-synthase